MRDMSLAEERANLQRFAIRMVGDGALADDIVQETLLRAHRSRSSFQGRAKLGTWFAAIAVNVARDHFRRQAAQKKWRSTIKLWLKSPVTRTPSTR